MQAGTGSQTGSAGRWGDYSAMEMDPVDDCTFWFTNEYLTTTGGAPWRTRIGSFQLPGVRHAPTSPSTSRRACGHRLLAPDAATFDLGGACYFGGLTGDIILSAAGNPGGDHRRPSRPTRSPRVPPPAP